MYIWQDEADRERQQFIKSITGRRKISRVWIAVATILGFHVIFLLVGLLYQWLNE